MLLPQLTGCTVMLIAKDGIYLSDAPREIPEGGYTWAPATPTPTPTHLRGRVYMGPG